MLQSGMLPIKHMAWHFIFTLLCIKQFVLPMFICQIVEVSFFIERRLIERKSNTINNHMILLHTLKYLKIQTIL